MYPKTPIAMMNSAAMVLNFFEELNGFEKKQEAKTAGC